MSRPPLARASFHGSLLAFGLATCAVCPAWAAPPAPRLVLRLVEPGHGSRHRPVFSRRAIEAMAAPWIGAACNRAAIEEAIARRYRFLGYVPRVAATCEADGRLAVTLRESSHRIDFIVFDEAALSRLGITPSEEAEEKQPFYPVPEGTIRAVLRGLLQTHEGDLYNHERYQADSETLRRLGYAIAFVAGPETEDAGYPSGAYLIQALSPQGDAAARRSGRRTNYLGGTGSYGPRQGGALGAQYEHQEIFGPFDRLTVEPRYNSGLGGQIAYQTPRIVAAHDPRRLYDLEIGLYSDFTHDRVLQGVRTDERRSGMSTTLGLRPLGLAAPHDLRLIVGARHERVHLSQEVPGTPDESLTFLQLGATEDWRHSYRWPSLALRLKPLVEFSVAGAGSRQSFVRPSLDGNLHARMQAGLEADFHLVAGTIDRHVASFEQWSLGGAATVRGYREDAFLGRSMGALQSELWLPFVRGGTIPAPPGPADATDLAGGAAPRFQPRAARLLKWALFADGGLVSGTASGGRESLFGAGVGLRFVVPHQPLVVRIDYGWSLGAHRDGSFPYFSIGYRY